MDVMNNTFTNIIIPVKDRDPLTQREINIRGD